MTVQKFLIKDITNNLDGRRKPLNGQERAKIRGSGKYPYYGANNIIDYVDEYLFDQKILCVAEDGGYWGAGQSCAYVVNGRCWVNNHAHVLEAKSNVLPEYLMHYLNWTDLTYAITGSTRGKLTKGSLDRIEISLPPLEKQKEIVTKFEYVATLLEKRRQSLSKLDQLTQSIFLDMFGDPIKNPKKWKQEKLSDIAEIKTGNTPSRANEIFYGDYIEWIKSDNLNTPFFYATRAKEFLSKEGLGVGRKVKAGSILVTCIAGSKDCIGNAAIVDREVTFNQQINSITCSDKAISEFIYGQLLAGKKLIQNASTNSMKGMVSKSNFENIRVIVPPLDLQRKYKQSFLKLNELRSQCFQSEKQLVAVQQSLNQKFFGGQ